MAKFIVTSYGLNVRPTPAGDNVPLGETRQGTVVEKVGESSTWSRVIIDVNSSSFIGKVEGWVATSKLEPFTQTTEFSIDTNLKEQKSPLTAQQIDELFEKRDSPLKGIGAAVISASQKYSINATYIVAHAILESGWGTSRICIVKKNLFGWGAFDATPFESAMTFNDFAHCIDYVMGRINVLYLSPEGKYFVTRACLGDKTYGMSVNYASDAKWGLSIAHLAREIEKGASGVPDPQPVTNLLRAIELVNPFREYYKPHDITGDGHRETFCNWLVADVLDQLNISLPRYGAEAGHYPRPHPIYGNQIKNKPKSATELNQFFNAGGDGNWSEISRAQAVINSNAGKIVLASVRGHIGIVIPGGHGSEVRIAQAGRTVGKNISLEEGFGSARVEIFQYIR